MYEKLLILRTPGIGPAKYNNLLARFGSVADVVRAIAPGVELRDAVAREMERAQQLNIHYISDDDARYPDSLRRVKNHPPVISVRGNINALHQNMVAMVGTRHATAAGMNFVADMAHAFAKNNVTVVSGMAIGTDTAASWGVAGRWCKCDDCGSGRWGGLCLADGKRIVVLGNCRTGRRGQ